MIWYVICLVMFACPIESEALGSIIIHRQFEALFLFLIQHVRKLKKSQHQGVCAARILTPTAHTCVMRTGECQGTSIT